MARSASSSKDRCRRLPDRKSGLPAFLSRRVSNRLSGADRAPDLGPCRRHDVRQLVLESLWTDAPRNRSDDQKPAFMRALLDAARLMRLRYLRRAWRLWRYNPRYHDPREQARFTSLMSHCAFYGAASSVVPFAAPAR